MPRYLLTPSLHDNWRFYQAIESKEKQEFLNTLWKVETTDPEALERMNAGKVLESHVVQYSQGKFEVSPQDPYGNCVREIGDIVRGGLWQQRIMFDVQFFGMDFLIYGKADVIRRDVIYDIKKSDAYKIGKYTGSVQHPTYLYGAGMKKFSYLISDGESVFREDYVLTEDMVRAMFAAYEDMVDGIMADADFRIAYLEKWPAFGDAQGIPRNDPGRNIFAG